MSVIKVENIGKRYRIGELEVSGLLRDKLALALRNPSALLRRNPRDTFWALRDISFEVQEGEVLGLIGRNGAGKSTLLKVLSRITAPTVGYADIHGRVGSLLEVGTGFHPELTGRENVFLNGAILGMGKSEIARKFDEIVAFAEIERFIDTPVKRYSSGMYVRLAFAVAAHLETEILFVDEVLSVGDVQFQKKCLGKMGDVARHGRTVILISHNMAAITRLCPRCLVLSGGEILFDGDTRTAIFDHYAPAETSDGQAVYAAPAGRSGPHVASARVEASNHGGEHDHGRPMVFEFDISVPSPLSGLCFAFQIVNEDSLPICHFWLYNSDNAFGATAGLHRLRCEVPSPRLYMGTYTLTTWLSDRKPAHKVIEILQNICRFSVRMTVQRDQYDWAPRECVYLENGSWRVNLNIEADRSDLDAGCQVPISRR